MLIRYKLNLIVLYTSIILGLLIAIPALSQVGTNVVNDFQEIPLILEETNSEESFLPPKMNTLERDHIYSPAEGLIIYNTDSMCLELFEAGAWYDLCSGNSYALSFRPVTNPATGKTWMDRNLGAEQASTASGDFLSYGYLYQWGRANDGHQEITWSSATIGTPVNGSTATLCSSDICPNALFVYTLNANPRDWQSPQNATLWQGTAGINNPCPVGYRLPTDTEFNNEYHSWSSTNAAGAFASPLKFPVAGYRSYFDGTLNFMGTGGYYWSSTVSGTMTRYIEFGATGASLNASFRAFGLSVRCIKD